MKRFGFLLAVFSALAVSFPAFADGILQRTAYSFLPLLQSDVTIEIIDQVYIVTVEHTFNNNTGQIQDVTYHFPVPNSAMVTGFGDYIGGQLHLWSILPGQQGGGGGGSSNPGLTQYLGDNPLSIPLNDIPPGQKKIYLQYTGLMDYSFGDLLSLYPLYTPSSYIVNPTQSINIDIDITSQREILDGYSLNYPQLNFQLSGSYAASASLILTSQYPPEDFDFIYTVSQEDIGCWLYTYQESIPCYDWEDGYYMLICEPGSLEPGEIVQKYFTFILDKSGSMSGNNIFQAKAAACSCVVLLNPDDYFNVIDFNNIVSSFRTTPVLATPENIASALSYISAIAASGSTNINDALLLGLNQQMGENSANQIIFLTDGQPTAGVTNTTTILQNVQNANDDTAAIFVYGIGTGVNQSFLQSLASQNWGQYFHIEPGQPIGEEIINFFLSIMNPVFVNVDVDYGMIDVNREYPNDLFSMYFGSQTLVFGRYTNSGTTTIRLSGSVAGQDTTLIYPGFNFPEVDSTESFVARMWAIQCINWNLEQILIHGEEEEYVMVICSLGVKFNILTPYTGFVEVENLCLSAFNGMQFAGGNNLTWSLNHSEPGVTFDVLRSDSKNGFFIQLNGNPIDGCSYMDSSAEPGKIYYYKIRINTIEGSIMSDVYCVGSSPQEYMLLSNYPNPFNAVTEITYSIPVESHVKLELFNTLGQKVKTLYSGVKTSGVYTEEWNGTSDSGYALSSGQYFYRLTASPVNGGEGFNCVKKLVLLK